jgi:hypothetical protein
MEVPMIRLHDRCPTLSRLIEVRASLRRQEIVLLGALHDVQAELRSWQSHRTERSARGLYVPHALCILWDELAERERELALDVLHVRAALQQANREIRDNLGRRGVAS